MIAAGLGLGRGWQAAAGLAVVAGHVWPVWLRFRGGKGVAAAAGAFAVVTPWAFGAAFITFALTVALTRYVSLGSILAVIALAIAAAVWREPMPVIAGAAAVATLITLRHRENIRRLLRGTELRMGREDLRGHHAGTEPAEMKPPEQKLERK